MIYKFSLIFWILNLGFEPLLSILDCSQWFILLVWPPEYILFTEPQVFWGWFADITPLYLYNLWRFLWLFLSYARNYLVDVFQAIEKGADLRILALHPHSPSSSGSYVFW